MNIGAKILKKNASTQNWAAHLKDYASWPSGVQKPTAFLSAMNN